MHLLGGGLLVGLLGVVPAVHQAIADRVGERLVEVPELRPLWRDDAGVVQVAAHAAVEMSSFSESMTQSSSVKTSSSKSPHLDGFGGSMPGSKVEGTMTYDRSGAFSRCSSE